MTAPKGSGGPPTEPGWYWVQWNAEEFDGASWVGDGAWVAVNWKPDDEWPVRVADNGYTADVVREWGPRIHTPDESEPAPPTDAPADADVVRWRRLVMLFANADTDISEPDDVLALTKYLFDAMRRNAEAGKALRDRVRVLETAAQKARGAVSIERVRGLLDRALGPTSEGGEP